MVGTMFALPWYLTWFGHSLNQYRDVVRLYDFFLASPPLMPLYVTASLVIDRRQEVFEIGCDMASIHCLLSQIPDNLDFESILQRASKLYKKYPPHKLERDVKNRVQKEYVFDFVYILRKITMLFKIVKHLFSLQFYLSFFGYGLFKAKQKHS